jgi:hypothetical protein
MIVSAGTKASAERWAHYLALVQGIYFLATGLWPIVHLASFLAVTGPKTDFWLVQAFGLLVAAIGGALLSFAVVGRAGSGACRFGVASAVMLAFIDVLFVARRAIPPVYLLDALPEALFAAGWLIALRLRVAAARAHQP